MLKFIILGIVLENDLTGYDIKKVIENGIGVFYRASFGSLYPALKTMTEKGFLITSEKSKCGRQKIFYHITDAGRNQFFDWLTAPIDIFEGTNTHLAKVYFFDKLSDDIREQQLLKFEVNYENYLSKLEALEKEFNAMDDKASFYYKLSTLYYGICITKKIIQWCKHIRAKEPLTELIEKGGKL